MLKTWRIKCVTNFLRSKLFNYKIIGSKLNINLLKTIKIVYDYNTIKIYE